MSVKIKKKKKEKMETHVVTRWKKNIKKNNYYSAANQSSIYLRPIFNCYFISSPFRITPFKVATL
jgi:hypothetical protein